MLFLSDAKEDRKIKTVLLIVRVDKSVMTMGDCMHAEFYHRIEHQA